MTDAPGPLVRLEAARAEAAGLGVLALAGLGLGVWGLVAAATGDAAVWLTVIEAAVAGGFVVAGAVGLRTLLRHRVTAVAIHDDHIEEHHRTGPATVRPLTGVVAVRTETVERPALRGGGTVPVVWLVLETDGGHHRLNPAAAAYPLYPAAANRAVREAAAVLRAHWHLPD